MIFGLKILPRARALDLVLSAKFYGTHFDFTWRFVKQFQKLFSKYIANSKCTANGLSGQISTVAVRSEHIDENQVSSQYRNRLPEPSKARDLAMLGNMCKFGIKAKKKKRKRKKEDQRYLGLYSWV